MNPLTANFPELYQRHLCRHSQYGINVIHFAALVGTYLALFQIADWLFESWWVVPAVVAPYLAVVTPNLPVRLTLVVVACLALFFAAFAIVPRLPVLVDVVLLVVCYKVQNWSHKWYTVEYDMTAFNRNYRKGPALFVLLTLYELPIQLNYLVFDGAGGPVGRQPTSDPAAPPSAGPTDTKELAGATSPATP